MEGRKSAIVLLLALVALGFFAGQSSARGKIDFSSLVLGGLNAKKKCETCLCPLVYPPCCCICLERGNSCREGCKNCICAAGECYCGDSIEPDQCYTDGVIPLTASEMKTMLETPRSALE